jgi:hypothetical protein
MVQSRVGAASPDFRRRRSTRHRGDMRWPCRVHQMRLRSGCGGHDNGNDVRGGSEIRGRGGAQHSAASGYMDSGGRAVPGRPARYIGGLAYRRPGRNCGRGRRLGGGLGRLQPVLRARRSRRGGGAAGPARQRLSAPGLEDHRLRQQHPGRAELVQLRDRAGGRRSAQAGGGGPVLGRRGRVPVDGRGDGVSPDRGRGDRLGRDGQSAGRRTGGDADTRRVGGPAGLSGDRLLRAGDHADAGSAATRSEAVARRQIPGALGRGLLSSPGRAHRRVGHPGRRARRADRGAADAPAIDPLVPAVGDPGAHAGDTDHPRADRGGRGGAVLRRKQQLDSGKPVLGLPRSRARAPTATTRTARRPGIC